MQGGGGAVRRSSSIKMWWLMLLKEEANSLVLEGLLWVTHVGVFSLTLTEQAPTQVSRVGSLVGIMMGMALHLE